MADSTLGIARTDVPTTRLQPPADAAWQLSLSFVYAEDGSGYSAGDAFDVSGYTWRMDFMRENEDNAALFSLTEGSGIDVTDAATGTLVISMTAAQTSKASNSNLVADLEGLASADIWAAWSVTLAPQKFTNRHNYASETDDLGTTELSVGASTTPITLSVSVSDAASLTETTTKLSTLSASRDMATSDAGRRIKLDGYNLTKPVGFAPDRSLFVFNPSSNGSNQTVALPGGSLTVQPGEHFEIVFESATVAYALPQNVIEFS